MKLPHPFIQLPLLFDAERLAAEVAALGESCWMPHPQGFPGNSMLPLIAVDGDPRIESFAGEMRPTPWLERCPYLMQTMATLDTTMGRSRLMRLSGHAEVTRHADQGYYWADRVRVHVPIVTQPTVRFECGDAVVNMAQGECWIFDTWRQHRVLNDAAQSRIHLVVDTVGGQGFWSQVEAGRTADGEVLTVPWQPRRLMPGDATPAARYEVANVPKVMTPWEIAARTAFLLAESRPHPNLVALQRLSDGFCRQWLALWAAHGESGSGLAEYRAALAAFMAEVHRLGQGVGLVNELVFNQAMDAHVAKMAVTLKDDRSAPAPVPAAAPQASVSSLPLPGIVAPPVRVGTPAVPTASEGGGDPQFDRPVFIVSAPRSGSTMLFEALSAAPQVFTIGGESHTLIEGLPELSPVSNGLGSNRLTVASATPQVVAALRQRFHAALVDRNGARPATDRIRMLEKTPKNSLRVPFLARVFPEARFVFLYRDPREVLGSMLDAWNSGRFRTYPGLPGWPGPAWSMLLTPGWPALVGKPLADVVAGQWETTTRTLLDDLRQLPAGRVVSTRYADLVAEPEAEIRRLCGALELPWDRRIDGPLPAARYTLSQPAPDKWRKHAELIEPRLPRLQPLINDAEAFVDGLRVRLHGAA